MCGIVGFFSTQNATKYNSLLESAHANKHRGNKDGWGVIDLDNDSSFKKMFSLDEVVSEELVHDRGRKAKTVGILSYKEYDEDYYQQRNVRWKKEVGLLKNIESSAVILHHRAKSVGPVEMKNTHPITVGTSQYVHNGTVPLPVGQLRAWMQAVHGFKIKGDTDTEVLANAAEYFITERNMDASDAYELLTDVFGDFGVLIRVNADKEVEIFKTGSRNLWFYANDDTFLFISEPIPQITNFEHLYYMQEGYAYLPEFATHGREAYFDDELFWDYSNRLKQSIADWETAIDNGAEFVKTQCDCCKNKKEYVLRFKYNMLEGTTRTVDSCFECWMFTNYTLKQQEVKA